MTGILVRRGNSDTEAHSQEGYHAKMKAERAVIQQKSGNVRLPASPRSYGETRNTSFPSSVRGSEALLIP